MERGAPEELLPITMGESTLQIQDLPHLCQFLRVEGVGTDLVNVRNTLDLPPPLNRLTICARNISNRLSLSTVVILDRNAEKKIGGVFGNHLIKGDVSAHDVLHPITAGFERKPKPRPSTGMAVYKAPESGLKVAISMLPAKEQAKRVEITNQTSHGRRAGEQIYRLRPRHIPDMDVEMYLKDFLEFSLIAINGLVAYGGSSEKLPSLLASKVPEIPETLQVAKTRQRKTRRSPRNSTQKAVTDAITRLPSGVPEIEQVINTVELAKLEDIGGYEEEKQQVEKIALSFKRPEIAKLWGDPGARSVLLHGPPGTGKTTLAEALASEASADLRKIDSTVINDMFVSNGAKNMKKLFDELMTVKKPTVVLFDEVETIVDSKGSAERVEAAGVFKREIITLLKNNPNIIIAATTNDKSRIDPAIIRSGRFDAIISVPLPNEVARRQIWEKKILPLISVTAVASLLSEKTTTLPIEEEFRPFGDMDMDSFRSMVSRLAEKSDGLSGADIENAFRMVREAKMLEHIKTGSFEPIVESDFLQALDRLRE